MEKGDAHDELLILSKGVAISGGTVFEAGTFWGELQFLGLETERTISVIADSYCEIASIRPEDITSPSLRKKLVDYATLRRCAA
eukprot:SAG11_NODE_910_length_6585_cov_7.205520_5_plen_84_part_00